MTGGTWIRIGAISGALAVSLGAFGAHGLAPKPAKWEAMSSVARADTDRRLANFETAARYHMYHALAIVAVGLAKSLAGDRRSKSLERAAWAFLIGSLAFSGSLYAIGVGGPRWVGMIVTPYGGLCLIFGWIALAWSRLTPAASGG